MDETPWDYQCCKFRSAVDLDQTIAHLMVTTRNNGYAQGYVECTQHVTSALKVDRDASRSATRRVDTSAEHAAAKAESKTCAFQ
ncbi:hypothetical protein HanPI659440_Chr03g0101401 [Helianthus annuus]|nr:hypothetical protein HanPI659440_Chr03g0101401 [Helianthus annuus]